ncbi:hypothetical protein U0070_019742, partial [Myodes glareolus]
CNSTEELERALKTVFLGSKAKKTREDRLRQIMFIEREQRSRLRGTRKLTWMWIFGLSGHELLPLCETWLHGLLSQALQHESALDILHIT